MGAFVKKTERGYIISEGLFDFVKAIVSGKVDIAGTKDDRLTDQGKKLKKGILDMEAELEKEARKAGMSPEEYVKKVYGYKL